MSHLITIPKIVTPAEAEVFTLEECRAHLSLTPYVVDDEGNGTHPHDELVMNIQSDAREFCEAFTGMSIVEKEYEIALDAFPDGPIPLPMPPLVSITGFTVGDEAVTDYAIDQFSVPQQLVNAAWPTLTPVTNQIRVRYVAGFGTEPLPRVIRRAMLLILGHWYENREDTSVMALHEIPLGAEYLLRQQRVLNGFA